MKRFRETTIWTNKPWFRALTPRLKCLWNYLCDTCDHAGVIEPDWEMASLSIGEPVSAADLEAMKGRIQTLENGKLWIVKFIAFQYGEISPTCKAHAPIFRSIAKNAIPYGQPSQRVSIPFGENSQRVSHTLKEEDKDKDKDSEGKGVQGENPSAETIVSAYPRRENVAAALTIVTQHLSRGEDAAQMLAGTQAIAAVIRTLPAASRNAYVPNAVSFFRDKRWNDDPDTWNRLRPTGANGNATGSAGGRLGTPIVQP